MNISRNSQDFLHEKWTKFLFFFQKSFFSKASLNVTMLSVTYFDSLAYFD